MNDLASPKLRLDKWLWYARVTKSRTLAAKLVQSGHVRVNREKIRSASHGLKIGDVLTIALNNHIRLLKVQAFGTRRGPASEAAGLFEEMTSPVGSPSQSTGQSTGQSTAPTPENRPAKRPDKRERRKIMALKEWQDPS